MTDLFENSLVCGRCSRKTEKGSVIRDGFRLRFWRCANCEQRWFHPGDLADYREFSTLKKRGWQVKLRMVGNSWAVSIPREIIEAMRAFNRDFEEMDRFVRLCFEQPRRLSLIFGRDEQKKARMVKVK